MANYRVLKPFKLFFGSTDINPNPTSALIMQPGKIVSLIKEKHGIIFFSTSQDPKRMKDARTIGYTRNPSISIMQIDGLVELMTNDA